MVIPRSKSGFSDCILFAGSSDRHVLSLGSWHDVHVRMIFYFCFIHLTLLCRYTFAVLLSGCRSVMRPGAMWFIKDPQDQNSHPIRDILDRPTLVQLRKIFISGLMYSFVVACVVGSVAGLLLAGNKSVMPFRWKNRYELIDYFLSSFFQLFFSENLYRMSPLIFSFSISSCHTLCITSDPRER